MSALDLAIQGFIEFSKIAAPILIGFDILLRMTTGYSLFPRCSANALEALGVATIVILLLIETGVFNGN